MISYETKSFRFKWKAGRSWIGLNVWALIGSREKKYVLLPQHLYETVVMIKIKSNNIYF